MSKQRAARKSLTEWQALVQQQADSGLSAAQFCETHKLGYVSFCRWRNRILSECSLPHLEPPPNNTTPFIKLDDVNAVSPGWTIRLQLGNGVQLTLSQQ